MSENNLWNQNVKAILVGVTDYSAYPKTSDLPFGKNDVALMGQALVLGLKINPFNIWTRTSHLGSECYTKEQIFDNSKLKSKRSECVKSPGYITKNSFLEGIKFFLDDISPEDIVIFYFTGHGTVVNGKHCLLFSDGAILTQSVIDLFTELNVSKRILFLDSCMSGQYELTGGKALENNYWIKDLLKGGTAVFASSRPDENSGYADDIPVSLFTAFLWNAMTNRMFLRNGEISLDTIRDLVYKNAEAWNEGHKTRQQHPVFRSSMAGTVSFKVAEKKTYRIKQHFLYRERYIIASVNPLHSQIAKRYAVKVMLRRAVTEEELIEISREIICAVRPLDIYKNEKDEKHWHGRPADIIFIYYGHGEEDMAGGNYEFRVTWADEGQDRNHWYRTDISSKISDGMLLWKNPDYGTICILTEKYTGNADAVIDETKKVLRELIKNGQTIISIYQEFINGKVSQDELRENIPDLCRRIDELYIGLSEIPIPPAELIMWSLLASNTAGDVQDLSFILSEACKKEQISEKEKESIRTGMEIVIRRFHSDLEMMPT